MRIACPAHAAEAPRNVLDAVRGDPHYAAWDAALGAPPASPDAVPMGAPDCATFEGHEAYAAQLHRLRVELLESLAARGVAPSPAPPGVAPWPWGPGAGADSRAPDKTGGTAPRPAEVTDVDDVSVLHDNGTIVFVNREGWFEVDPLFATQAFYAAHHDEYDFFVLFTTFPNQLSRSLFLAYHLAVANDVTGLGYTFVRSDELFSDNVEWTHKPTAGRLQSFVHMNSIDGFPAAPDAPYSPLYTPVELLGHEIGHRWLARIRLDVPGIGPTNALLGRQRTHWSFALEAHGSPLEGNYWVGGDPGWYTTTPRTIAYSPLDLYLMGLLDRDEVDPATLFWLSDADSIAPATDPRGNSWTVASTPTPGVTLHGVRNNFTIDEVINTNGYRIPAAADAPHDFRAAFALVSLDAWPATPERLGKVVAMRNAFADWFHGKTLGRGTLDASLNRVPARIVFQHHPHGNFESDVAPIPVTTRIELEQWSLPTALADIEVELWWSANGGTFQPAAVQSPAAGEFQGLIPPQPFGTVVRYWMRARSTFPGHEQRWPAPDGEVFQFTVVPDGTAPVITHTPRARWSRLAEPPLLRALVRDTHGVSSVLLEYRLNGGPLQTLPLAVQGVSDLWEIRFAMPGRLGDTVEYRLRARDVAAAPHESVSPPSGFHVLKLVRTLTEDAETDDSMWTHRTLLYGRADEWHRDEVVNPIQGLYSWKMGPKNAIVGGEAAAPQYSVLESPIVDVFPGGSLTFTHRYALRRDEFIGYLAWDGAVVQWQDVNRDAPEDRWFLLEPDTGYPFPAGVTYDADSPFHDYPVYAGLQAIPQTDRCSFPPWIWNRRIRVRFTVAIVADSRRRSLDGWVIDDIQLDPGPPSTAIAVEGFGAERTAAGVQLAWQAHDVEPGDVFVLARAVVQDGDATAFQDLARIEAAADRNAYAFTDAAAPAAEALAYRLVLRAHGADAAALEVRVAPAPRFALHAPAPNPFNPTTTLRFELPRSAPARLTIYDVRGRVTRTLVSGTLAAGPHIAVWNGRDDSGHAVASGLYLARLESAGRSETRRLMLVR